MSRHRSPIDAHTELDLFDALIPEQRSGTGPLQKARPERPASSAWPSLPSPRVSRSGPMPVTSAAAPAGDIDLTTADQPAEPIHDDRVTGQTALEQSPGRQARTGRHARVRTAAAPRRKPGAMTLVACAVTGLLIGTTATVAVGRTFRSAPEQGITVPPVLVPAPQTPPTVPAPQAAPARPQQPAAEPRKGAATKGSGGPSKSSLLAQGPVKDLHIWLTGYSFQDNTPPSSATVSAPILHKTAGGTGTYADPITVAVPGHASDGDMAWKGGTRFYLPTVQRYVIVEDSGASPAPSGQDGHLDMWVDGQGGSKSTSDSCMDKITGTGIPAIMNPPAGKPVIVGPITSNGACHVPAGTGNND
jgi:hypothetical protein